MGKKIFFGNHKGGVGKTTSVFQIGINMAKNHNKKVLLLDLDSQGSLSKICAKSLDISLENISLEYSLNYLIEVYILAYRRYSKLDILKNKSEDKEVSNILKKSILKTKTKNLCFIPTKIDIVNGRLNDIAEQISRFSMSMVGIAKIFNDIDKMEEHFDYILIDCPPGINTLIQSVFLKSDYYIIPTIADDISSSGVTDFVKLVERTILQYTYDSNIGGILLEKIFGKSPTLLGVLETKHNLMSSKNTDNLLIALNQQLCSNNININKNPKEFMVDFQKSPKSYVFKSKIRDLNNMTDKNNYGIPYMTSLAQSHQEYDEITKHLLNILEKTQNEKH